MKETTTDNNGVQMLYEAPQIEVIEVEVEKGFATSYDFGENPGGNVGGSQG